MFYQEIKTMKIDEVQRELIYMTAKTNQESTLKAIEIARKCVNLVYSLMLTMEEMKDEDNKTDYRTYEG